MTADCNAPLDDLAERRERVGLAYTIKAVGLETFREELAKIERETERLEAVGSGVLRREWEPGPPLHTRP